MSAYYGTEMFDTSKIFTQFFFRLNRRSLSDAAKSRKADLTPYTASDDQRFPPPRWRRGRAFALCAGDRGSIPSFDKTGSDSYTAKRSALGVSVMGPR